jgi:hypothetical protein
VSYLDPDLVVYALLLLLYLLFELLQSSSIGRGAICLENLDIPSVRQLQSGGNGARAGPSILIGERCDLLLFYLVIGEFLLVLLPVRTRGRRLWWVSDAREESRDGVFEP